MHQLPKRDLLFSNVTIYFLDSGVSILHDARSVQQIHFIHNYYIGVCMQHLKAYQLFQPKTSSGM